MATHGTLHVEVVTAERALYSGEAKMVQVPGARGQLGILPGHAALLTTLAPGMLRIKANENEEPFFVSGGFLEVSHNRVTILANTAEQAKHIDETHAQEARQLAKKRLKEEV